PKAEEAHLMYGTAIHGALQDFFQAFEVGEDPGRDFLLTKFADYLNRQPMVVKDYQAYLERGQKALGGYYDFWQGQWRTRVLTEFNIKGIILTPDIRLTGKIDKLEFLNDHNEVNVVDYKTGKPKTRGFVEGETKASAGDIKRQIVFYKLLLDNYDQRKYKMVSAEIDFVEPDPKGNYHKEAFAVSDEEVTDLIEQIKTMTDEVLNLKFWDRKCEDDKCPYCRLRGLLT
ncbi:MAG: PD-(D/E)XK nuclease family protein, partial [Patescibacteria group bacterium]